MNQMKRSSIKKVNQSLQEEIRWETEHKEVKDLKRELRALTDNSSMILEELGEIQPLSEAEMNAAM